MDLCPPIPTATLARSHKPHWTTLVGLDNVSGQCAFLLGWESQETAILELHSRLDDL